jgi:non-heme chloroperoxidase
LCQRPSGAIGSSAFFCLADYCWRRRVEFRIGAIQNLRNGWDAQMLFFLAQGYRVIAHDRRGHGRSAQVSEGNEMDRYADDLAELVEHLDLQDAIHVGHSAGGGEVARYLGRHGESRVAKAVLISAVTPSVLQTDANPAGVPQAAFEALQAQLAANRSEFYRAVPSGPFYNFDKAGVESSEAVIANWWRQGMMGSGQGPV